MATVRASALRDVLPVPHVDAPGVLVELRVPLRVHGGEHVRPGVLPRVLADVRDRRRLLGARAPGWMEGASARQCVHTRNAGRKVVLLFPRQTVRKQNSNRTHGQTLNQTQRKP